PAEVFEHHAPLLGRETGQLVPRRIADFRACAGRAGEQRGGYVEAVGGGRRAARALLLFVGLFAREASAGIEQLAVQALLTLDDARLEPARFELTRQLARFLRQRARGPSIPTRLQPLELLGQRALARG